MGEAETMKKHDCFMRVHPEDLRIAKGIASFKGVTLKQYFGELVDNEAQLFQKEIKDPFTKYRRRKN